MKLHIFLKVWGKKEYSFLLFEWSDNVWFLQKLKYVADFVGYIVAKSKNLIDFFLKSKGKPQYSMVTIFFLMPIKLSFYLSFYFSVCLWKKEDTFKIIIVWFLIKNSVLKNNNAILQYFGKLSLPKFIFLSHTLVLSSRI